MLVAKPGPVAKLREIANTLAAQNPEVSVESFFLPLDESCNFQWNVTSTRYCAPILEWYVSVAAPLQGLSAEDPKIRRFLLDKLLEKILANPDYSVVVEGERVPLTVEYLTRIKNWICHAAGVELNSAIAERLGSHYSNIHIVTGPDNPWI